MFEKVYDLLKSYNINAYAIGQYKGDYKEDVVVIKEFSKTDTTDLPFYNARLTLYVNTPIISYVGAKALREKLLIVMGGLKEFEIIYDGADISVDEANSTYYFAISYNNKHGKRR